MSLKSNRIIQALEAQDEGIALGPFRTLNAAGAGVIASVSGTVLTLTITSGSAGAPTDADYLVGTAHADLSAEIVVGTTPGGELGGTWASPTVDSIHSGSAHHTRAHAMGDANDHSAGTQGDILYAGVSGAWALLAAGTSGYFLKTQGGGANPVWAEVVGGSNHDILSATHSDALAASVVLGDVIHGNATPKWARLAGQITTTKKFLSQTGTGAVSAVPSWETIADGDVPATHSGSAHHTRSHDLEGASDHTTSSGVDGHIMRQTGATSFAFEQDDCALELTIGDGTNVITTGVKGFLEVPYNMVVTGWTLVGDASGSIVIDVWKDTYANFPPTVADTIAGTEKPTLASAQANQDITLSSWTTALTLGDWLAFNVDSATTVKQVTLSIRGYRT